MPAITSLLYLNVSEIVLLIRRMPAYLVWLCHFPCGRTRRSAERRELVALGRQTYRLDWHGCDLDELCVLSVFPAVRPCSDAPHAVYTSQSA